VIPRYGNEKFRGITGWPGASGRETGGPRTLSRGLERADAASVPDQAKVQLKLVNTVSIGHA
jgi:hypothetical protein